MMRRARMGSVAAVLAVAWMVGGLGGVAHAELLEGECTGTVSFQAGTEAGGPFEVDAAAEKGEVYVVPLSDDVDWDASTPARSGAYSGFVEFALPFPFGGLRLDDWTGEVQKGSNSGTTSYDLPSALPRGVEFSVRAEHRDSEGLCVGTLRLKLEGAPFGSWYPWAALGLALLMALAFLGSAGLLRRGARRRGRSLGRGVLSAGLGVVFGAVLGLALVFMGVTPVDSALPFGIAVAMALVGLVVGGGLVGGGARHSETLPATTRRGQQSHAPHDDQHGQRPQPPLQRDDEHTSQSPLPPPLRREDHAPDHPEHSPHPPHGDHGQPPK